MNLDTSCLCLAHKNQESIGVKGKVIFHINHLNNSNMPKFIVIQSVNQSLLISDRCRSSVSVIQMLCL